MRDVRAQVRQRSAVWRPSPKDRQDCSRPEKCVRSPLSEPRLLFAKKRNSVYVCDPIESSTSAHADNVASLDSLTPLSMGAQTWKSLVFSLFPSRLTSTRK